MNKMLGIEFIKLYKGMNKLPLTKRIQILSMLVEGASMRSEHENAD